MLQGLSALALLTVCALASPLCPRGTQYWDTSKQQCSNCTTCADGQVVLRPCQPHTDTFCGPLSALRIDWSWVRPQKLATSTTNITPRAVKPARKKVITSTTTTSTTIAPVSTHSTEEIIIKIEETSTIEQFIISTPSPSPSQLPSLPPRPVVSAQPFSAAETLVWDWQAFTLVIAVSSCAIFLVLLAIYAVYQSRGSRRNNLQRELDEAAAHLSLFTSGPADQSELCADLPRPPPLPDIYATNQCVYLEKLLERKQRQNDRGTRGNIYVETGRQATPAPARRSTRWKTRQQSTIR